MIDQKHAELARRILDAEAAGNSMDLIFTECDRFGYWVGDLYGRVYRMQLRFQDRGDGRSAERLDRLKNDLRVFLTADVQAAERAALEAAGQGSLAV